MNLQRNELLFVVVTPIVFWVLMVLLFWVVGVT
jgi:hypothetical protein